MKCLYIYGNMLLFYVNVLIICYNKLFKFIYVLYVFLNNYERSKNCIDNFEIKLLWIEELNKILDGKYICIMKEDGWIRRVKFLYTIG